MAEVVSRPLSKARSLSLRSNSADCSDLPSCCARACSHSVAACSGPDVSAYRAHALLSSSARGRAPSTPDGVYCLLSIIYIMERGCDCGDFAGGTGAIK